MSIKQERMAERIRAGIAEGTLRPMDEREISLKASFLIGAHHTLERLAQDDASLGGQVEELVGLEVTSDERGDDERADRDRIDSDDVSAAGEGEVRRARRCVS